VKRPLLVILSVLACAQANEKPRAEWATGGPASLPPPSSILAVLAHRDELLLDDKQVAQLVELQRQLERDDIEAQEKLAAPARDGAGRPDGSGRPGLHRGRFGGPRRHDESSGKPVDREEVVAAAVADNDTRAFLRVEPILSAEQWDRARAIAEKYRAEYSDKRDALERQARQARPPK
jgi:hypothetical protein